MATHIRPRRNDPRNAAIIDDDTGAIVGLAQQCDACHDWINTMDANYNRGACASVHPYTWRCYSCILARRSTVEHKPSDHPLLEAKA